MELEMKMPGDGDGDGEGDEEFPETPYGFDERSPVKEGKDREERNREKEERV